MLEKNQDKSSHGGKRNGSGRKAGAATQKTREVADKAAAEGITPLEVMLFAMRATMDEAQALIDGQKAAGAEKIAMPLGLLADAAELAKDAAPYIHPRLSSTDVKATVITKTLDQELSELNAVADAASNPQVA